MSDPPSYLLGRYIFKAYSGAHQGINSLLFEACWVHGREAVILFWDECHFQVPVALENKSRQVDAAKKNRAACMPFLLVCLSSHEEQSLR